MALSIETVEHGGTEWERKTVNTVKFYDVPDSDDQELMINCSDFVSAANKAAKGNRTWDTITCNESGCSVKVQCVPTNIIKVADRCPYLPDPTEL